jgi:O-antigen ligase
MLLPLPVRARQLDIFGLVPLVTALVPLLICPGLFAYFDITPKVALLLFGAALMLFHPSANLHNLRTLLAGAGGRWLAILLAAEWLVFALATATSTHPKLSFEGGLWRRLGLISETGLLLFVLLAVGWLAGNASRVRYLLRAATVSGGLAACYGIAQYFGWDPLLPAQAYQVGEGALTIVRPPGTLGHADYLGAWLVIVVFFGLALQRTESSNAWKSMASVALGLAAIAVWLVASRRSLGVRTLVFGLACVAGLALFFVSPPGLKLRARLHWSLEDPLGGARILLWRDSLRMSVQRPFTGFGPETFATEFARFESPELSAAYPDFYHESPHNVFLDALTSGGVAGLLAFVALCGLGVLAAIRACRAERPLGLALGAAFAGTLVAQQFTVFIFITALYFHLLVALLVVVAWKPAPVTKRSSHHWIWVLPSAIAVLLLAAAGQMLIADRAFAIAQQRIASGDLAGASSAYHVVRQAQPWGPSSDLNYSLAMQQAAARTPIFTTRLFAGQEALQSAIRAAADAEDRQNAWYNLATLLAQQNDPAGTERALRTSIAWAPNWFKPHWALARLLAIYGHHAEAIQEARIALDLDGGHDPEVAETWKQLQASFNK